MRERITGIIQDYCTDRLNTLELSCHRTHHSYIASLLNQELIVSQHQLTSREGQHVPDVTFRIRRNGEWATVHHTDSIDCHTVIRGSCALILDDGDHWLEAGDCVIVNGVDHAWRTGPDGCVSSSMFIATPPLAEG